MIVALLLTGAIALSGPVPGSLHASTPFAPGEQAAPPTVPLATLEVPGGTAGLAEAAGLDPALPRARVMLAAIRSLYDVPEGVDADADARRARVREYLAALPAADTSTQASETDLVPLPLSRAAWDVVAGSSRTAPLLSRILGSRDAALIYYGLAALDGPTSAWLTSQPGLLRTMTTGRRPGIVAAFGRSLRVRNGRLQVPGGPAAEPLWTELVGERPDAPGDFTLRLLDRDGGRLALFYDTLAHLDPGQQAFALGTLTADLEHRRERFAQLYDEAARPLAGFDPALRPFDRVAHDLAHLLLFTRTSPAGAPGAPASEELWRAALTRSGIPERPERELKDRDLGVTLDAAALASLVSTADAAVRRDRVEAWFFGQRVFRLATEGDYPAVLVALRAVGQYKALLLTLERMDIVRPDTYVLAVRCAERLGARGNSTESRVALAQFQAALGIVERARFSRTIDAAGADALVRSLCGAMEKERAETDLAAAAWIEKHLLSSIGDVAVPASVMPDRPIEAKVLAAMAGAVAGGARARFEWEGQAYRVDPGAGELRRLAAIRARQRGVSLDAALAIARAGAGILAVRSAEAATAARQEVARLGQMFETAEAFPFLGGYEPLHTVLAEADSRLDRQRGFSRDELVKIARPVLQAADVHLAAALLSMAYAPHLGYPDSPVLLGGDPALQHDFGFDRPPSAGRGRISWEIPTEVRSRDAGWRLTGSILGLDVVLARLSLRRAFSETLPPPPAFREVERAAFAEGAVLSNPFDVNQEASDALIASVRAGRASVSSVSRDPDRLQALLVPAGLDEWRTNLLGWMGSHEPERVLELLSLAELADVGGGGGLAPGTPVSSGWSLDAELRGVSLRWHAWTTLAGRKSTSLVPALVPDLAIGMAEALDHLHVPAALGRGVLLMAAQDLLDSLRTNHDDDWMTLVDRARRIAAGPVEDYVAGQTIWGALTPAEGGEQ